MPHSNWTNVKRCRSENPPESIGWLFMREQLEKKVPFTAVTFDIRQDI